MLTSNILNNNTSFNSDSYITISREELLAMLNEYYEQGKKDALQNVGITQSTNNVNN
jgi:hypothetical protein